MSGIKFREINVNVNVFAGIPIPVNTLTFICIHIYIDLSGHVVGNMTSKVDVILKNRNFLY